MDAREGERLDERRRAEGAGELGQRLVVGDAARVLAEHAAEAVVVEPGHPRGADREEQRVRLAPVGVVGRVDDLLRRELAEEIEQVDRAPDGRVEEDARDPSQPPGEPGHVRDAGVRDDQPDALEAAHERLEVARDRRQAASSVDQDRNRALEGELEDRPEPLVVEGECLRPWVELDPARAEVERAPGLVERPLRQVEAHEGEEPAVRPARVGERAVVRHAEAGLAVGLVEAEDEGARDAVAVEDRR